MDDKIEIKYCDKKESVLILMPEQSQYTPLRWSKVKQGDVVGGGVGGGRVKRGKGGGGVI